MSASLLPVKPKRRKGVRRLNRVPIYAGAGAIAVVILIIVYTYNERVQRQATVAAAADTGATHGSAVYAKDMLGGSSNAPTSRTPVPGTLPPVGTGAAPRDTQATTPAVDAAEEARKRAWAAYYQQVAQLEQAKTDMAIKAMSAGTDDASAASGIPGVAPAGVTPGYAVSAPAAPGGLPAAGVDSGAQAEKRAFLAQDGDPLGLKEDLLAGLHTAKLDTIMQGTAIPGVMIGGLTSDSPGMVVGSIGQDIYDSATGNDLLIPQGSRVVGTYDNSVSNGQERIGVIWNRIIFPDTSSIQIGSMEGADQGGYAGFHDLVNTHFWDKFAAATIISIAGAAAQVAQPQQSAFSGYSPSSVASGQLTQGYSQLGQEYARAGLSIPNTIEIRPGYQFVIMCAKDVHLPPYVDRRNAAAAATTRRRILQ